jgi:hypothetical protein
MHWFRSRRSKTHRVVVTHVEKAEGGEIFLAECECGWSSSHPRRSDALRDAYGHDAHVRPEIEEHGGYDLWQCFFCGAEIDEGPVCIRLNWVEGDAEQEEWHEEWCGAHQECLVQHASEAFPRQPPLFGV